MAPRKTTELPVTTQEEPLFGRTSEAEIREAMAVARGAVGDQAFLTFLRAKVIVHTTLADNVEGPNTLRHARLVLFYAGFLADVAETE